MDALQTSFDAEGNNMAEEVVSVAILEALPGKEAELAAMLRELYSMMNSKGYCRDWLYRDSDRPDRLIHLRRWKSVELRSEAQIDPMCTAIGSSFPVFARYQPCTRISRRYSRVELG